MLKLILVCIMMLGAVAMAKADEKLIRHNLEQGIGSPLPFSTAVQVGDMLYLSGVIGNVPGTAKMVEGGIAAETRQTMDTIKSTLEALGSSMGRVVKCTVFMADIDEWAEMNRVYVTYFDAPPARSALGANGLALGARVEIECMALAN